MKWIAENWAALIVLVALLFPKVRSSGMPAVFMIAT
jgi:hypothetical protein